jgi:heme exporter protein D
MLKRYFALALFLFLANGLSASGDFEKDVDYTVNFEEKSTGTVSVLHIIFKENVAVPEMSEIAEIIKSQLNFFGNSLSLQKNIMGSAWYRDSLTGEQTKITFQEGYGAFVWLGSKKSIVPFPSYVTFLKQKKKAQFQKKRKEIRLQKLQSNNENNDK